MILGGALSTFGLTGGGIMPGGGGNPGGITPGGGRINRGGGMPEKKFGVFSPVSTILTSQSYRKVQKYPTKIARVQRLVVKDKNHRI